MNVESAVNTALANAHMTPDVGETPGRIHRNRSEAFVEALAAEFRAEYSSRVNVAVLSRHNADNRHQLGLNEFLVDVAVCGIEFMPAGVADRMLTYLTSNLWAVKSEFARDSRKAVFDFNKLVLSSAEQKLFVGSAVGDEAWYLGFLGHVADFCTGSVFAALVPHPEEWGAGAHPTCRVWTRAQRRWVPVS